MTSHTRVLTGRGYRRDACARYSYSSMGVRVGEGDDDNNATGESGVMIVWFYGITRGVAERRARMESGYSLRRG